MKLFKSKAEPAQAATSEDIADAKFDDTAHAINQLEDHIENEDPAARAALQLSEFRLVPGAQSLLDRAMDNLAQNEGTGIEDPDARLTIKLRAGLITEAGNDLNIVLAAILASNPDPKGANNQIYSMCYNVLKAAGFIANLDYRRWADPKADFDIWAGYGLQAAPKTHGEDGRDPREATGEFASDQREEAPSAPDGLDNNVDMQWEWLRATYGGGIEDEGAVIFRALEDLGMFLNLLVESMGWQADNPMPYVQVQEKDGTFTPIYGVEAALNEFEIRRKASLKRRHERNSAALNNAQTVAREMLAKALARKTA